MILAEWITATSQVQSLAQLLLPTEGGQHRPMLIKPFHAAHVIALLERGGLTLDQFRLAMGSTLATDKAGNGDTYYEWQQVWDYYTTKANVPTG